MLWQLSQSRDVKAALRKRSRHSRATPYCAADQRWLLHSSAVDLRSDSGTGSLQSPVALPGRHHADSMRNQQGGRALVQRQAPGAALSKPQAASSEGAQGRPVRFEGSPPPSPAAATRRRRCRQYQPALRRPHHPAYRASLVPSTVASIPQVPAAHAGAAWGAGPSLHSPQPAGCCTAPARGCSCLLSRLLSHLSHLSPGPRGCRGHGAAAAAPRWGAAAAAADAGRRRGAAHC